MSRQKRPDLLFRARSPLKIFSKYLRRCEEYRGLAHVAHGVELRPGKSSWIEICFFPFDNLWFCFKRVVGHGQSLASWVLRARSECNILSDHQRCIETSQPGAEKNYCTFSRTSRYHPPLWTSIFLEITCLSKAFCLVWSKEHPNIHQCLCPKKDNLLMIQFRIKLAIYKKKFGIW